MWDWRDGVAGRDRRCFRCRNEWVSLRRMVRSGFLSFMRIGVGRGRDFELGGFL